MNKAISTKVTPFIENISGASVACLITMLQGNLLAVTLGHWIIASQTGLAAGTLASVVLLIAKSSKRWAVATLLGFITAVVDFFVHSGMSLDVAAESLVTGAVAALLSYLLGRVIRYLKGPREETE